MSDDKLLRALGHVAAEEKRSTEPKWEKLVHGELSNEEIAKLEKLAAVDEEAEALVCVELNAEEDRRASGLAGVDHPPSGVFNGSEQEGMKVRAALNSVHYAEHAARERFVLHSASVVSQLHGMSVPDVMLIATILSRARARVAAREAK